VNKPFHASRLKIERAKQHISDLNTRIAQFQGSDFYRISFDKHPQTGKDCFSYQEIKVLPSEELALVIGDALHNLKGALDLAINTIIFNRLSRYDDFARFPFRKIRDDLIAAINGGLIHQASEAVSSFIVDSVKPYKGGNDALWTLHELNILDKHRLLLPVMQVAAVHDLRFEDDRGEKIVVSNWIFTGGFQISDTPFIGHANVKITNKGKPTLHVFFDKGLPCEGQPVLPTLHQLTEVVTGVIDGIEKVFLAE